MSSKVALLRQCLNGTVMRSPVCRPIEAHLRSPMCRPIKAQLRFCVDAPTLSYVGVLIARPLAVECGHGGLCVHCADALWNAGPASRHCP